MRFKTFIAFVGPSLFLMLIFIAAPLGAVLWNSFHVSHPIYRQAEVETCTPGFLKPICTTSTKQLPVMDARGNVKTETSFVGWESYRNVLELERLRDALASWDLDTVNNINFWKALRFTLVFTLVTMPLVIGMGLLIALGVNGTVHSIKGPVIFISLLPFIITPVIGALAIRWLFIGDGILTAALEAWLQRDISMFAQGWTIEILMYGYRVWHVAPFAFIVFYAGLQTVNQDILESALVDGASRLQRLRFVVIPHLMPLIIFVTLIHLMDAYRVFEEIIGFSSHAYVISLQWLTWDFLMPDESGTRAISRASASSMLTMIGIIVLLVFPLRRIWRERRGTS